MALVLSCSCGRFTERSGSVVMTDPDLLRAALARYAAHMTACQVADEEQAS